MADAFLVIFFVVFFVIFFVVFFNSNGSASGGRTRIAT